MGILEDIDSAAWDLEHNRVSGFYPVARNFNIAENGNHPICNSRFDVYSYTTRVAMVGRVDWDALYKACDRECDRECINGNGAQFINVREVA